VVHQHQWKYRNSDYFARNDVAGDDDPYDNANQHTVDHAYNDAVLGDHDPDDRSLIRRVIDP
jgi:hypothetical protein